MYVYTQKYVPTGLGKLIKPIQFYWRTSGVGFTFSGGTPIIDVGRKLYGIHLSVTLDLTQIQIVLIDS